MEHDLVSLSINPALTLSYLTNVPRDLARDLLRDDLRDVLRNLLRDVNLLRDLLCNLLRCGFLDDVLLHYVVKFIVNILVDFDSHYIYSSCTELSVADAWKQLRVESVRCQNPKVMVKLYYELYHIFRTEGTKDDYQNTACGYMTNVLWEGLYSKDFKTFMYNMQLFEHEVTERFDETTKIVDAINLRYMLDCAQAELAVAGGIYTKKGSRGDASRAFRVHVNKYTSDEKRYNALRRLPGLQNVSEDVLHYMTSESGAIVIRNRGDASAHGNGQGEENLDASIMREPEEVQHILKEIQHLGLKQR